VEDLHASVVYTRCYGGDVRDAVGAELVEPVLDAVGPDLLVVPATRVHEGKVRVPTDLLSVREDLLRHAPEPAIGWDALGCDVVPAVLRVADVPLDVQATLRARINDFHQRPRGRRVEVVHDVVAVVHVSERERRRVHEDTVLAGGADALVADALKERHDGGVR
jgi:hypothetical protein